MAAEDANDALNDDQFGPEDEVREDMGMRFKPPVEVLPDTKRTEELQKRRIEEQRRKKEAAEEMIRQRERDIAEKRKAERDAKRNREKVEEKKREAERKKAEEEETRKKMEGGLEQIVESLSKNVSAPHIAACGIKLTPVNLRLLTRSLEDNHSCISLDLNRKGLKDEDGDSLACMLEKNVYLQKLECEGNSLGVEAAEKIGEALKKNTALRSLNLESNNLTAMGDDQKGIIKLADALMENKSLRVLMLSKNHITAQAGEHLVKAIEANEMLTMVDLSGNDPSLTVEQLRRIDAAVRRNRERASAIRRDERRERFALYNEEFKCRQYCMQVEAKRLEIEAHEERRLNRMKARFDKWVDGIADEKREIEHAIEELKADAVDRADAGAKKGKKGKKKK